MTIIPNPELEKLLDTLISDKKTTVLVEMRGAKDSLQIAFDFIQAGEMGKAIAFIHQAAHFIDAAAFHMESGAVDETKV